MKRRLRLCSIRLLPTTSNTTTPPLSRTAPQRTAQHHARAHGLDDCDDAVTPACAAAGVAHNSDHHRRPDSRAAHLCHTLRAATKGLPRSPPDALGRGEGEHPRPRRPILSHDRDVPRHVCRTGAVFSTTVSSLGLDSSHWTCYNLLTVQFPGTQSFILSKRYALFITLQRCHYPEADSSSVTGIH
jgi:hypothetical protein